ncbi:prolyl endopeptidase [Scaptodrosophila lebanonensis]|uniref:Prolyl endopeptidase n=1 Tax=Drosophila lebanonensis TaxID=7225 RepID=A0A6J2U4H5_DROLE|nr:prolyl endopeptidase [Scaptodrosophila lebanonensis]
MRHFLYLSRPSHQIARNLVVNHNKVIVPNKFSNSPIFVRYLSNIQNLNASKIMKDKFMYPIAKKDEKIEDNFHGTKIKDVYRWLEDPNGDDTQKFVDAQNNISQPFLEGCDKWEKFNAKLTKLWNYPKYGCPMKYGDYYYYFMNTGLQNQSVLYQQKSLKGESKVFLDPNSLSADGTIALTQKSFSDDGNYMAYGLSESGSDWIKIRIRNAETGEDFPEILDKVKFTEISWTKDNKGFFYGRYPDQDGTTDGSETKQNENQKLYYHRIGESQDNDVLVAEFPEEPSWRIQSVVSDCGKYLILAIVKDCRDNIVYYADLDAGKDITSKLNVKKIVTKFESDYDYITNEGSKVYFRTNKNAPNYRVIIIDFENPDEKNWTTLVSEHEKDVLDWVKCVSGNKLLLCYIRDVKSILQVHALETGELTQQFDLDIGTIVGTSGKKKYSEIFYNFSSFLNPGTIYHYDFSKPDKKPEIFRKIELNLEGFRQDDYKVEQIFYNSKDGTKIPMFIIRKKRETIKPRPCLLYGYGGFNISMLPSFGLTGLMFVDTFDGVLAYPNIRGGGEYGEKWHNEGRLLNKQNVFDDFQAAAEYLVDNKYTTKDRLAIQGGSNGGLLVGACINQRPDLFGAAIAQVGVMDMLRFHKFTIGHAWCSDYGNPSEKDHFENLYKFSPLHNVHTPCGTDKEYPSTLILTADHDDRVSPLHSLKFIAALQEAVRASDVQKNPLLLRVYKKAGHGAGKPTSKRIEESTDILTFMYKSLNIDVVNL